MIEPAPAEAKLHVEQQDCYIVHLSVFDGPLDLLLHLIEKRQMEITTISLVDVTDQYMAYLQRWEADLLPLANMAAFVSIAARLLFIKSQNLLPQLVKEPDNLDGESATAIALELQQHLQEYKLAKDIAKVLKSREEQGLQTYGRSGLLAGIEAHLAWNPPTLTGLEVQGLARSFQRLLYLQTKEVDGGSQLMPTRRVRVSERIAAIRSYLETSPLVSLSEILKAEHSRLVIIVTFIAILELWKWERIEVVQVSIMSPILLERGGRWNEVWQEMVDD